MSSNNLPDGWKAGEVVSQSAIYSDPPAASEPANINLYGLAEGDSSHRIYTIPADTPVADVVRFFEVGSRSATSYGDDADETIALVAEKATSISALVPCRVTFADAAGLKLRFLRQVTEDDLEKIEALFPEEQMMQAGLDRYASEWDGEGPLLAPVLNENLFHFWWD
jgi:hypothetical protein